MSFRLAEFSHFQKFFTSQFMKSQLAQNKILVVEDDPDIGRIAQLVLEKAEYSVRLAEHARRAWELIGEDAPDLIICDVMMPDISGLELLEQLKNNEATQAIPVIMMSALTDDRDVRLGQIGGAEYYLKKPFSAPQLTAAVKGIFATMSAKARLKNS